jgi:hypothetical protein
VAFISEEVDEADSLSGPPADRTLTAVRRLTPGRRSVVVLRFSADMRHPRFAENFHRALGDLTEGPW